MINVRALANSVSSVVNPNVLANVRVSNGYTVDPDSLKQIPTYADAVPGPAQVQALDGENLRQVEKLNIQGKIKAIYLYGVLAGVVRPDSKGGDLIDIGSETWLVVMVLEGWATWTKVAAVLQDDE